MESSAAVQPLSPAVAQCLDKFGIAYTTFPCDPDFTHTEGLVAKYGFVRDQITNTIIVTGRADPRRFAACIVLSTYKVDVNERARALMRVKRARFATAEETAEQTAMTVGGITPFGLPDGLPVYVDERIWAVDEVLLGGGNLTAKVLVHPDELLKLPAVSVVTGLGVPRS